MKAIVHIGMPKTGTTAIQRWLGLNSEALQRQGLIYDRVSLPGVKQYVSHVELHLAQLSERGKLCASRRIRDTYKIRSLADQRKVVGKFERKLRKILDRNPGAENFVFSSEQIGATARSSETAQALHKWLSQIFDEVCYIVYFRQQEDWLTSNYVQTLRRGATHGFVDYCRTHKTINYMKLSNSFARIAGEDRLTVRLFEQGSMVQGDVLCDFAEACGISIEGMEKPARVNESLGAAACSLLRNLNILHAREGTKKTKRLVNMTKKALNHSDDPKATRLTLSHEMREDIRSANAKSNERLRQLYFPDRSELFPPREAGPQLTHSGPVDVQQVLRQIEPHLGRRTTQILCELAEAEFAQ